MTLDSEQRRALEMLAGSPRGITEAILATKGLAGDRLAGLVRDGMATGSERDFVGRRSTERGRARQDHRGWAAGAPGGTLCGAYENGSSGNRVGDFEGS